MSSAEESALKLTRYIFTAPHWILSLFLSLLLSLPPGYFCLSLIYHSDTEFARYLSTLSVHFSALLAGILLLGIPALVSAPLTKLLVTLCGAKITFRRTSLLSALSVIAVSLFITSSNITAALIPMRSHIASATGFALGAGFICGFRFLILLAIAKNSISILLPSSTQTIASALMFFILFPSSFIILIIISSIFFSIFAFLFVKTVEKSTKKTLGVSGIDLIRSFLSHLSEGSREMEEIFSRIGITVDIPVFVLAFKRRRCDADIYADLFSSRSTDISRSTDDVSALKAVVVVPLIHSGLTGDICGGDLPKALSESIECAVFVPHSMTNHDFDLTSSRDIGKIVSAAKKALESLDFRHTATPPSLISEGDVKMLGQRFGNAYMLIYTLSPIPFDDADFTLGISAIREARAAGAEHVAVIDAHNSGTEYAKVITTGSKVSYDILKCVSKITHTLKNSDEYDIKMGVSFKRENYRENIGHFGIRAIVTDVSDVRTAYVLIDGNNMVAGLRERIIRRIKHELHIQYAEVMTTDSHALNKTHAYKFVGDIDPDAVENTVIKTVSAALSDMEPVEVAGSTEIAENIHVFGEHFTAKLISIVNTITSMATLWIIFAFISALSISLTLFSLLVGHPF